MPKRDADNRKQEFLDTALALFYEKGFDNTTIRNIIDRVGVSKGAFYHYFGSKEEVLETIARQYVEKKLQIVKRIAQEENLNALEKLNRITGDMLDFKMRYSEMRWKIYKILARNNNIKLEKQILDDFLELSKPYFEKIFKQGVEEGIFDTDYPEEAAELYIHLNNIFKKMASEVMINNLGCDPDNLEIFKEKLKERENARIIRSKFAFYEDVLERILGVKRGSLKIVEFLDEQLRLL